MSDSFTGGVFTGFLIVGAAALIWGYAHCHSFGLFTACF